MKDEELQDIIDKIESANLKEEAYFGIFQYGGGADESFIKANRQGLELFALELLKASKEKEKNTYSLDEDEQWIDIDSDTQIDYIKLSNENRIKTKQEKYNETWKDKIIKPVMMIVMLFLLASLLIGIGTIFKWIFKGF